MCTHSPELKTGVVGACYIYRHLVQIIIIIVVGTNYIIGAYFVYNWESIVLSFFLLATHMPTVMHVCWLVAVSY